MYDLAPKFFSNVRKEKEEWEIVKEQTAVTTKALWNVVL